MKEKLIYSEYRAFIWFPSTAGNVERFKEKFKVLPEIHMQ